MKKPRKITILDVLKRKPEPKPEGIDLDKTGRPKPATFECMAEESDSLRIAVVTYRERATIEILGVSRQEDGWEESAGIYAPPSEARKIAAAILNAADAADGREPLSSLVAP